MANLKTALVTTLVASFALGACSGQKPAPSAAQAQPAAGTPPTAHPVAGSATQGAAPVTGPVLEVIDASTYTYVRVKTDAGEIWAVAPHTELKRGERVVVPRDMPAANYHSQSLNRDFPLIYFAEAIAREGEAPPPPMSAMPSHGAAAPPGGAEPPAPGSVKPAEGGSTIAGIWTNSKALDGKTVIVRGKVVKFNGGILGRNWLHIQDGTGKAADGTNDLTVTTDGVAKVGDIVTISGKLVLNKDFGAGYSYRVMVESAVVAAK